MLQTVDSRIDSRYVDKDTTDSRYVDNRDSRYVVHLAEAQLELEDLPHDELQVHPLRHQAGQAVGLDC